MARRVRKTLIKSLVVDLLKRNQIKSAPIDVESIAKSLDIEIVKVDAADDEAGFMKSFDSGTAIIGVNKNHAYNRRRFTIAHEIGHFLLHELDEVYFDGSTSGSRMLLRDKTSSHGIDVKEREANQFAAELLMPAHFLEYDLSTIKEIFLIDEDPNVKTLARKYRVSVQALTYRLTNLGHIQI